MQLHETWSAVLTLAQANGLPVPFLPAEVVADTVVELDERGQYGRVWTRDLAQTGEDDVESALEDLGDAAPEHFVSFAVKAPTSPSAPVEIQYVVSGPALYVEVELDLHDDSAEQVRHHLQELWRVAGERWSSDHERAAVVVWPGVTAVGALAEGQPGQRWIRRHTTRDRAADALRLVV